MVYLDYRLIFSVIASLTTIVAYYPYIRDIFLWRTKPHLYTWLIWMITTWTATIALWFGKWGFSMISMTIMFILVTLVVLLSFKYGTKDITKRDTFVLIMALISILIWWQLNNPILAIIMISIIDFLGYIPTYRKSWNNPYEETILFWWTMIIVYSLTFFSNKEFNLLTTIYILTIITANIILFVELFLRRKVLEKNII